MERWWRLGGSVLFRTFYFGLACTAGFDFFDFAEIVFVKVPGSGGGEGGM